MTTTIPQPMKHRTPRRRLQRVLLALLAVLAAGLAALGLVARLLLAPTPGEWHMPLRIGPWQPEVGVPSLLRLATTPTFGHWLQWVEGRRHASRWGPLHLQWQRATNTLQVHCAPCSLRIPALGDAPLQVEWLTLSLRRRFDTLEGSVVLADRQSPQAVVHATFTGQLQQDGLRLHLDVAPTAIAHWYAVFAPGLPELAQARIGGSMALRAEVELPAGRWQVDPLVKAFTVQGLGTESLAHTTSACGSASGLRPDDWLPRAVLSAEDQRFFEHAGYDLRELLASFASNQGSATVRRGGSTIGQQLAKRIVTGDDRSATRKLRELLYAVEMEQTLGKARILQLYLDNAPWGHGICGAQAAARHYFGRSARRLSPAQAVQLAAMLHNPEAAARAWSERGGIDLARAEWVARGVRGVPGAGARQRESVVRELQALAGP